MGAGEHDKIIRQVAHEALVPLGLSQRGRSRLWVSDAAWRAFLVEFQPSSWSKGTYCNVAVMWLWDPQTRAAPHFAFHVVERLKGGDGQFISWADDPEGFERSVAVMATQAAKEIAHFQATFVDLDAVARHYASDPPIGWPGFHRGVALGVMGRGAEAKTCLTTVAADAQTSDIGWVLDMGRAASALADVSTDRYAFMQTVEAHIVRMREGLRLPAIQHPLLGVA